MTSRLTKRDLTEFISKSLDGHPTATFHISKIWVDLDGHTHCELSISHKIKPTFKELANKSGLDPAKIVNGFQLVGYDGRNKKKPYLIQHGLKEYVVGASFAEKIFRKRTKSD